MKNFIVNHNCVLDQSAVQALIDECSTTISPSDGGYPGITSISTHSATILAAISSYIPQGVDFDMGPGTGLNIVRSINGLGNHVDKPLYELDDNFQLLPIYENRTISSTVCAVVSGNPVVKITNVDGTVDEVQLSPQDVLVIEADIQHELLPSADVVEVLCGFFCTTTG